MKRTQEQLVWSMLRLAMGGIFLWAFVDKLFGFGFATTPDKSWLAGGSPTFGFLKFGTSGPFAPFYQSIAGHPMVDLLFMMGLLVVGLTLTLGILTRIGSYAGMAMLFLMWTAVMPPENNPVLDDHIIYILVLFGLTTNSSQRLIGFGKRWGKLKIVSKFPILK